MQKTMHENDKELADPPNQVITIIYWIMTIIIISGLIYYICLKKNCSVIKLVWILNALKMYMYIFGKGCIIDEPNVAVLMVYKFLQIDCLVFDMLFRVFVFPKHRNKIIFVETFTIMLS